MRLLRTKLPNSVAFHIFRPPMKSAGPETGADLFIQNNTVARSWIMIITYLVRVCNDLKRICLIDFTQYR